MSGGEGRRRLLSLVVDFSNHIRLRNLFSHSAMVPSKNPAGKMLFLIVTPPKVGSRGSFVCGDEIGVFGFLRLVIFYLNERLMV